MKYAALLTLCFVLCGCGRGTVAPAGFNLFKPSTWSGDTTTKTEKNPRGQTAPGGIASEAKSTLWPFTLSGLICILAGVAWLVFFKDPKLLFVGIGLAMIPALVMVVIKTILIPVSIGVAVIGLIMLGALAGRKLGWWDWEKKSDEIASKLRENAVSIADPVVRATMGAQADAMKSIGTNDAPLLTASPVAVDIIHAATNGGH